MIIPVPGPPRLIAMHPVVRRIEIRDQFLRRLGKGPQELLDQYFMDRYHTWRLENLGNAEFAATFAHELGPVPARLMNGGEDAWRPDRT